MQIAYGRAHEGLNDDQLSELSRKLQTKEGGIDVAGEIVGMRMLPRSTDAPPPSETIKRAGREFLGNVDFKRKSPHADYLLGVIIRASLDVPDHEDLARTICERIKDAVANHHANPWDVGDIIDSLTKVAPVAVLDVLVETYEDSRSVFHDVREDRGRPLQSIPDATLLDWANIKPHERYPALAQTVRYSDANDDDKATAWSSIAEAIINHAPNADAVLSVFLDRFIPMSWSGSRAQIMATRLPLMESLLNHPKPDVATWAKAHITDFTGIVEKMRASEAGEDRSRDERFE